MKEFLRLPVHASNNHSDDEYDSYLLIANDLEKSLTANNLSEAFASLHDLKKANNGFEFEITLTVMNNKRVIYSPTGPLNRDYDDVRRVGEAANAAVKKALSAGGKKLLLINLVKGSFPLADQVALLGALEASYVPLEIRECKGSSHLLKVDKLGFWHADLKEASETLNIVNAIDIGRIVTKDIGGSDPERMCAQNVLAYVNEIFKSTEIKITVVEGQENFERDYPCFAAVNRAANTVPRHRGRIIKLEYDPSHLGPIDTTLFLVGKGITYDTGGADVKHGGHMSGMHRDKCGAAFVAGFFKTLTLLKPKGLKVFGTLCLARNSIGEESYVADELITARSKKRLRIVNTDAEGRMVMCDLLNEAKDMALNEKNPFLFTIATLTGHVIRAYGDNYTGIMCNGPAKALQVDRRMQESGDLIADPYEISTIRREDYQKVAAKSEYEDLTQATNNPSTQEARGHQFPSAFLIEASGLDKHGNDSDRKLPYTHVDIAGSSGPYPGLPTGSPLPSFVQQFVLQRLSKHEA